MIALNSSPEKSSSAFKVLKFLRENEVYHLEVTLSEEKQVPLSEDLNELPLLKSESSSSNCLTLACHCQRALKVNHIYYGWIRGKELLLDPQRIQGRPSIPDPLNLQFDETGKLKSIGWVIYQGETYQVDRQNEEYLWLRKSGTKRKIKVKLREVDKIGDYKN